MCRCSHTADKQGVPGEHSSVIAIFEEVTDAVLSVAWGVECFDLDVFPYGESFTMARRLGDLGAVLSSNDGHLVCLEHLDIAARMVMMAAEVQTKPASTVELRCLLVGVDNVGELGATFCSFLKFRQDSGGVLALLLGVMAIGQTLKDSQGL